MFGSLCGCVQVFDQKTGGDFYGDGTERKQFIAEQTNSLEDLLKKNLHTIRGRRQMMRDIPVDITPTKFDDDEDPPSENEDGEETMVISNGVFAGQSFDKLKSRCQESGQLFVDPQFPPSHASLFLDQGVSSGTGSAAAAGIEWKRPAEISSNPSFVLDGICRFDAIQGELGDCWLSAAIADLTLQKKLISQVVPLDQSFVDNHAGIFRFRFWQYGEWVEVVVDDLLPTRDGRLIYMRSDTEEVFWSALLEKAYAKLYGSYSSLRGGTTAEAMVDFSGGCSEQYSLKNPPRDIYSIMLKCYARASMMACSIEPDPKITEAKTSSGLIRGHAYSVTKVVKVDVDTGRKKGQFPLVRVRNPWGKDNEWKGAWSDKSPEWRYISDEEKESIGLTFEWDGEFYMAQADFLKQFDTLEICNLSPDSLDDDAVAGGKIHWHYKQFQGSWTAGHSAGGCRNFLDTFASNPQFRIVLEDSDDDADGFCTCVISLMQKGSRKKLAVLGEGCLTIGYAVYKLENPEQATFPLDTEFFRSTASTAKPDAFANLREVTGRFRLNPGTYVVVPSTFEPNEEGDFLLRVFSEAESSVDCVNDLAAP